MVGGADGRIRTGKNDIRVVVDDFHEVGKLGHGLSSIDELKEIDIGDGDVRHPMYISAILMPH
jgi:hypothetical protein